jgi:predicted lactoylglutathione lyase
MTRMIFVNLPVADLPRAMAFYDALGFANEPRFTDDTAACMVWSEAIHVMLLTHVKWRTFTDRPMPARGTTEVMLCISCDSREDVERLNEIAGRSGGTSDAQKPEDHGFMISRTFTDPDDHVWEAMWMDPAVAAGEASAMQTSDQ